MAWRHPLGVIGPRTITVMAWEWVSPVVGGVVGVAGIASGTWSTISGRRVQQRADAVRLKRERLEALYISMLATGQATLTSVRPNAIIVGERIKPPSTEDTLLRAAQIATFANPAVVKLNRRFAEECTWAGYWWQLSLLRVQEISSPGQAVITFPPDAEGMDHTQLAQKAQSVWSNASRLYDELVEMVRKELGVS